MLVVFRPPLFELALVEQFAPLEVAGVACSSRYWVIVVSRVAGCLAKYCSLAAS